MYIIHEQEKSQTTLYNFMTNLKILVINHITTKKYNVNIIRRF